MTTIFREPGTAGTYLHPIFGGIVASDLPPAAPQVSGVITITAVAWGAGYGPAAHPIEPGTVSLKLMVDNQEVGDVSLGPPFSFTLDTTTLKDGSHVVSFCVKKSAAVNYYSADYIRSIDQCMIVANNPPVSVGAQTVPVPGAWMHSNLESPTVDFYDYPGTPPTLKSVPFPYVDAPSANGDPSFRDPSKWWLESLTGVRHTLYTMIPRLYTTRSGGVIVAGYNPEVLGGLPQSKQALRLHCNKDGPRNVNTTDPYSAMIAHPDGESWLIIEAPGRLAKSTKDGTVTTIVGFRWHDNELMYDYRDVNVPDAQLYLKGDAVPPCNPNAPDAPQIPLGLKKFGPNCPSSSLVQIGQEQQLETGERLAQLGPCICHPNDYPTDICIDDRNSNIWYVCAYGSNVIVRIDATDEANPVLSYYAGQDGVSGYQDGPAAQALFNKPYSIQMINGELYIADFGNSALRKVSADGSTVTTVLGGTLGAVIPPMAKITVANRDLYSLPGTVNFPTTLPYPQCIRKDSKGNLIVWEGITSIVRKIDLTNKIVTRFAAATGVSNQEAWAWLDVDYVGTCGPVDDIFLVISNAVKMTSDFAKLALYRLPIEKMPISDVSLNDSIIINMGCNGSLCPDGELIHSQESVGHYPWVIALSRTEGRFMTMGYGTHNISSCRVKLPTDPSYMTLSYPYQQNFLNGWKIWKRGTVMAFPWGSRPAFSALHGEYGHNMLGLDNFDDLVMRFPDDASLGAYIQAGMDGKFKRPEVTGNDLRDLIYFIRRCSLAQGSANPVKPGPTSPDKLPPAFPSVQATRNGNTVTVTWTTDSPSLGFIAFGVGTTYYHGWSAIEDSYQTQHTATFDVPDGQVNLCAVGKDVAGNVSKSLNYVV